MTSHRQVWSGRADFSEGGTGGGILEARRIRKGRMASAFCGAALALASSPASADEFTLRGYIEPEARIFTESASSPRQKDAGISVAAEATFQYLPESNDGSFVLDRKSVV